MATGHEPTRCTWLCTLCFVLFIVMRKAPQGSKRLTQTFMISFKASHRERKQGTGRSHWTRAGHRRFVQPQTHSTVENQERPRAARGACHTSRDLIHFLVLRRVNPLGDSFSVQKRGGGAFHFPRGMRSPPAHLWPRPRDGSLLRP